MTPEQVPHGLLEAFGDLPRGDWSIDDLDDEPYEDPSQTIDRLEDENDALADRLLEAQHVQFPRSRTREAAERTPVSRWSTVRRLWRRC